MSDYSRLKSIELHNFMGFVEARAVFDESGSLNLKGYNSSGKSAFLTACAVAMMNVFASKQAKYINHGKDYFRIILCFDDGVVIVRDKYKNGQSLYEMYQGEKKVYTSKVGDKLSRVDAVPQVIENYLGLIGSELGYLNYQVRRDPLWLVETKGSENYYTLNEVLKSVEIAQANALLNTDKNALNTEIAVVESEYNTLKSQLTGMSSVGEELLGRLYDRQSVVNGLWAKYDILKGIEGVLVDLNATKVAPELDSVNVEKLQGIQKVGKILEELNGIKYFNTEIDGVSYNRYVAVGRVAKALEQLGSIRYFEVKVDEVGEVDKLKDLSKTSKLVNSLSEAVRTLNNLNLEFKTLEEERDTLISEASKSGITFTVCTNCGTMLEVKSNG